MYDRERGEYGLDDSFRRKFGLIILCLVVLIVIVLLISSLLLLMGYGSENLDRNVAYHVFGAILPLIGTWLGALIAFYFSTDNFQSANRSLSNMIDRIAPLRKAGSIPVTDKMIPLRNIVNYEISSEKPENLVKIKGDILDKLEEKNVSRLPILDHELKLKYIIHRNKLDKYLLEKVFQDNENTKYLNDFTLEDLFKDEEKFSQLSVKSYFIVNLDTTLAEAKTIIKKVPNCRDIFITKNGSMNEPLIGWLTDTIIWNNL